MAGNASITNLLKILKPSDMKDADKLALYLFFAMQGSGFCYVKSATVMERLGWRSLDRVEDAYTVLVSTGRMVCVEEKDPFGKDALVKGYRFLWDAPVVVATPVATPVEKPVETKEEYLASFKKEKREEDKQMEEQIKTRLKWRQEQAIVNCI
jgi:heme exporter protein D